MMYEAILPCEAGVYAEIPDMIGVSFVTSELFRGTVADCLSMLSRHPSAARVGVYIETVDGMIHLDLPEIEAALKERHDCAGYVERPRRGD